jgi:hypothetical protein
MKKKIAPMWVLEEIKDMLESGVDIYKVNLVRDHLESKSNMRMLEWLLGNRELYIYSVLSKQYEHPDFYYAGF